MINSYIVVNHYNDIVVTALYFLSWIFGEMKYTTDLSQISVCFPESALQSILFYYSLSVFPFISFNTTLQVLKKYPKYR